MSNDKFEYFGWDEDPTGKYKQPKPNTNKLGEKSGYPQTDIDMDGIMVKGRWPSNTKKKTKIDMRGYGAAERGRKFYNDDRS